MLNIKVLFETLKNNFKFLEKDIAETSEKINNLELEKADAEDLQKYALKENPNFIGSISLGRLPDSQVGVNSSAMGDNVEAMGRSSYAEGMRTVASSDYQHVQGKYNSIDDENRYAHIVGNGSDETNRSNAYTLDWKGNSWYKGGVFVGGEDFDSADQLITDKQVDEKLNNFKLENNKSKDFFIMNDQFNDDKYVVQICNGIMVNYLIGNAISVFKPPTNTEYFEGSAFNPAGMLLQISKTDGTTEIVNDIENITYEPKYLYEGDSLVTIHYNSFGVILSTTIDVNVKPFVASEALVDFDYIDNGDGTYTLTGWRGTLNGVSSTSLIIPDNKSLIIE